MFNMTISMDHHHRGHRKSSWDSKSTVSSGARRFRRSPSSILSSDSDIRFTRKKLTSQYRCGCCIIATFLLLLLVAALAVYLAYTYFLPETLQEQIFSATFKVVQGDAFTPELADPNTKNFKIHSRNYNERLNLLFRRSSVRHGFVGTEVLALDGTEDKDLIVHFNVRIDPTYTNVKAEDLENILAKEIDLEESLFFQNLTIDSSSLEVRSMDSIPDVTTIVISTTFQPQTITTEEPPRKCYPFQLKYCSKLKYNVTTYPNIFGHRTINDIRDDVITFRELVDAECYRHAYDFVCQLLQPPCTTYNGKSEMILPCRSFCKDFMAGCSSRLTEKFKNFLNCDKFPEFGEKECLIKPGCIEEMQARALSPRVCDGVIDCQDLSDEKTCSYCPQNFIHCGIGRMCIHRRKWCDGRKDCPDGSDERACLTLSPNIEMMKNSQVISPHQIHYHSEGYVTIMENGEIAKLCTENLNSSSPLKNKTTEEILHTVGSSLCKNLYYQKITSVQVEKDLETNISYVSMRNPSSSQISFIKSTCPSKQVLKVTCSNLQCGQQVTHNPGGLQTLEKLASHADWPWHVALFKEDVHICDGTLISEDWLLTTISCFQGQPKAEWIARFGTIRLSSVTPWEQERRIIGMVKSPVEGSTIALIKLDKSVYFNDFIRPICLPMEQFKLDNCNTLGWTRNRDQLQRVQVKIAIMEKCENISISTVNSLCTETYYGKNDCNEEEFAGSSMICQNPITNSWNLIGITNWRIACSNKGTERPRMYDKIASNVDWIWETIRSETSS